MRLLGPASAAVLALLLAPAAAPAAPVGVVPILIGPLQVLLTLLTLLPAVLMAMAVAVGGMLLMLFKPAFLKAVGRGLWQNKIPVLLTVCALVGLVYLLAAVWPEGERTAVRAVEEGAADWPAYRGGPERRGAAPGAAGPAENGVVWTFADGDVKTFYSSPAVMGNRVYACTAEKKVFTDRGAVVCVDADTGGLVWRYSPGDFRATYSSPSVTKDYVVTGEGLHFTKDARVTCLKADTGERVWELRTHSHVESSPAIADGKVYIGAGDDGMYCIALAPGPGGKPNVLWHLPGREYPDCETSPIVQEGRVYFGLGEGGQAVVCAEAATGKEIWRTPAPYPVFGSPAIADGKVFVGMGNGNMVESAEAVRDKKIAAMKEAGKSSAEIEAAGKKLGPAGEVWALDLADGKVVWKHSLRRTVLGSIAAADGRLYFGSRDGTFHCRTTDNEPVGTPVKVGEAIVTSPAIGADHVYFVTQSGRLHGLDRQTLRRVMNMPVGTGGDYLSSPAIARGHVYVGTSADGLMCLGYPADRERVPVWAGPLGGPGEPGWADGSPLPAMGSLDWRYPKGAAATAVQAPVARVGGALYVAVADPDRTGLAKLVGRDEQDGTARSRDRNPVEAWFYPTAHPVVTSVVLRGDRVYLVDGQAGQAGRRLHCLRTDTGQALWTRDVGDAAAGELLLTEQRLLVLDGPDTVRCLWLDKKGADAEAWTQTVRGATGTPAEADGCVLVSGAEDVVSLRLSDGAVQWRAKPPAAPVTGPVIAGSLAAVGTRQGVTVLGVTDGAVLWSAGQEAVAGRMTRDEDRLGWSTSSGRSWVYTWTGREVARIEGGTAGIAPMLLGEQALCVVDGDFACVDLAAASGGAAPRKWYGAAWLGPVAAPPVLAESHLYFGTAQRGLVCVRPSPRN